MQGIPRDYQLLTKTEKKDHLSWIDMAILADGKSYEFWVMNYELEKHERSKVKSENSTILVDY
jgi:hypothetical protein